MEQNLKNNQSKISGLKFSVFKDVEPEIKNIPSYSGVYALVVRSSNGSISIKYIGCAINLMSRIKNHGVLNILRNSIIETENIEVWVFRTHKERKDSFERYLIYRHKPELNKKIYHKGHKFISFNRIRKDNIKLLATEEMTILFKSL